MGSPIQDSKMGVPEAVLEKVGSLPDIAAMSKDDLSALCKKLYEQGCSVFGEKFDVEYQVKRRRRSNRLSPSFNPHAQVTHLKDVKLNILVFEFQHETHSVIYQ